VVFNGRGTHLDMTPLARERPASTFYTIRKRIEKGSRNASRTWRDLRD
jgi:hypothetical protein